MLSQKYHNIFDYQPIKSDYPRWLYKDDPKSIKGIASIKSIKRQKREKISKEKLKIARKASKILGKIPTVKFIGITGSLAMLNATEKSDIDLMIVTRSNSLWFTRLVVLFILSVLHIPFRRAEKHDEANKICLNMWLDESDLIWNKSDRNIYTAHEIAQIVPLINKDKIYEKFLYLNRWILLYWPNSVKILNPKSEIRNKSEILIFKYLNIVSSFVIRYSNLIAFKMQFLYMKSKITRELITPTRAIFHPNDWGKKVLEKLNKS